jgi:hypothetical protein
MITIDSILPTINTNIKSLEQKLSKKDKRILVSFYKQVSNGHFFTENQANLFLKIIKENLNEIKFFVPNVEITLKENLWSKQFREIKKIRKISLSTQYPENFFVEFNFNQHLKEKIQKIMFSSSGCFSLGSKYFIPLTEENVFLTISTFKSEKFDIDEKLMEFFHEIEKIKTAGTTKFNVFQLENEKLKNIIENTVGAINEENVIFLQDRKFRYQYQMFEKNHENSLTSKIAFRESKNVFVNSNDFALSDVIKSLKELKRLPVLFVFNGHSSKNDKKFLEIMKNAIEEHGIDSDVGIYFRYDKKEDLDNFNLEVSNLKYNKNLSKTTTVAGISSNKLPKFMLNLKWTPESIISFTNNFHRNKSSVYFNDVDLTIYYGISKPLNENVYALM